MNYELKSKRRSLASVNLEIFVLYETIPLEIATIDSVVKDKFEYTFKNERLGLQEFIGHKTNEQRITRNIKRTLHSD